MNGLKLFDEITKNNLTIMTEGRNTLLIQKALEFYGVNDVEVITGIESISGKNQLKTLFHFLTKTNHQNKVIFIWDCDVSFNLSEENNTYPYILTQQNNNIAKRGIENMFPETLFTDFITKVEKSKGDVIESFDESRKRDFEKHILERNNKDDFVNFSNLIEKIKTLKSI